jgi:hypothetical protein
MLEALLHTDEEGGSPGELPLMGSTQEDNEALTRRLEELGVSIAPDQVQELADAYPALLAWMRIARELAGEPTTEDIKT